MSISIHPVILSGGAGTRLWPLSRRLRPKQFLDIHGDTTLFAETLGRVSGPGFSAPTVICNAEHRFLVAEELRAAGLTPADIILEPIARNTAPAIAAAALKLLRGDPDALMLVLPSDHVIEPAGAFAECVLGAADLAAEGRLVTFGVKPAHAETGYGYIQQGEALEGNGWQVARFVEKPDRETAEGYLVEGGYFWNAGIFLFSASAYMEELGRLQPDISAAATAAIDAGAEDLDFFRLDEEAFARAPAVSIDYAVMEKTDRAAVVPMTASWSDVGSWDSLAALGEKDANGNVVQGEALLIDSRDTYVRSEKPLVVALGIDGLAIIATDDTVMVLPRDRAQDVKEVVAQLEQTNREEHISHTRVYRPWGHYQNLEDGTGFLVKRIVVKPGAKLSLQFHHHRAEHWIVVSGVARVSNGDETIELSANQSTYIPQGAPHRLENPGDAPLHLIEVQSGGYIGEDDIVRLEDTYGRQ